MRQSIGAHIATELKGHLKSWMKGGAHPIPVLYYKLGERKGDTCVDLSLEGNDGTIHEATWTTGLIDNALLFDGIDDYVDVPTNLQFGTEPFTVMCWYKPLKLGVSADIIAKNTTWKDEQWMIWQQSTNKVVFKIYDVSANKIAGSTTLLELGQWIFIAAVRNGATIYIYINGILENTADISVDDSFSGTCPLVIGESARYYTRPVKGVIDEVRIYDQALTARQIYRASRNVF